MTQPNSVYEFLKSFLEFCKHVKIFGFYMLNIAKDMVSFMT